MAESAEEKLIIDDFNPTRRRRRISSIINLTSAIIN
jgi:hypothetical protein